MPAASPAPSAEPWWATVADRLEALLIGPTATQLSTADALGLSLPADSPSFVAAVLLQWHLRDAIGQTFRDVDEIPETLNDIEDELGVTRTSSLHTGTREEVSAWFEARYTLKTVRGLRELEPVPGDIVTSAGWVAGEQRVVSSVSSSGRIFMRGTPARSAWPNHLEIVARVGEPQYSKIVANVQSRLLDAVVSKSTNLDNFATLEEYRLKTPIPPAEAVRALEELLDSGERYEEPLQKLLTQYPQLLAATVLGGWRTYVIPKPKLGAEHVPDFLVLGINSVGPQWTAVELEGARHTILTKKGRLAQQTRHAIDQIEDWREWLATNVSYAQTQAGFHGLTSRAPGLVIIGRDDPHAERQASRARSDEGARIAVHSWDWLLRGARNLTQSPFYKTKFAVDNLNDQVGYQVASLPRSEAMTFEELTEELDDEEFNRLAW